MSPTEINNIPTNQYIDAEWYKPANIADVASMLEYCDTPQMLAELRETEINPGSRAESGGATIAR